MEPFIAATFLAVIAERLVEAFIRPVFVKFGWDTFALLYIGLVVGGVIGWLSTLNVFGGYIPNELAGRILTSIVIGGGSNLVHNLFAAKPKEE